MRYDVTPYSGECGTRCDRIDPCEACCARADADADRDPSEPTDADVEEMVERGSYAWTVRAALPDGGVWVGGGTGADRDACWGAMVATLPTGARALTFRTAPVTP